MLRTKPRVLGMQGECFTTELHSQPDTLFSFPHSTDPASFSPTESKTKGEKTKTPT
jgi:hypothetical protein